MKIVKSPPDGSCFFHSVGLQCALTARYLRKSCAELVDLQAESDFNGLKLKEWIKYETGLSVAEYSRRIGHSAWGGALEAHLLSNWLKRPIGIYKLDSRKKAVLITDFRPKSTYGKTIFLLYNGHSHYDTLA